MSLNHREIDLILSELELAGGRVQKIRQPDFRSLVFDIYRPERPFALYVSLAQGKARLHRLSLKVDNPETLQRFAQFLRARVGSGRIVEAAQVGSDRIVKLTVERDGEITLLWMRFWGGASNIIATTEDGTILDAFFRRPKRGEVSGGTYYPRSEDREPSEQRSYEVRDFPGEGSFNERVEAFYSGTETIETLAEVKEKTLAVFSRRETRLLVTAERLKKRLSEYEDAERFKEWGDLILSNAYRIPPKSSWAEVENFFGTGEILRIELDPAKTAEQNAEAYYERFRKAKAGLGVLTGELETIEEKLKELLSLKTQVENSEDISFLKSFIKREIKAEKEVQRKETPGLSFHSGDYTLIVGRSGKENDELLRRYVRGNDYWLHARDYPGAYVFIKSKSGKSIPLETLLDAGQLALFFSKGKASGQGELYYTQVKYLRRAKNGKQGLVLPTQEKNLHIRLDQACLDRLLAPPDIG